MTAFEVVPAIDLTSGRVVRLERGDPARSTVYADNPVACAKDWASRGAPRLHVVDLDRSIHDDLGQVGLVEEIVRAVDVPVQVAGGIRDVDAAASWLDAGAARVVIGAHAFLGDPDDLRNAVRTLGTRLVVAIDARDREVQGGGWKGGTGTDLLSAARRFADAGVRRLLCTDVARDGMLAGPNVELLAEVAETAGVGVIASGGVASVDDVRALVAMRSRGVEGVIVGRALYTGDVELADAMAVAR